TKLRHEGQDIEEVRLMVARGEDELWIHTSHALYLFSRSGTPNHPSGTRVSVYAPLQIMPSRKMVASDSSIFWLTEEDGVQRTAFRDMRQAQGAPHLNITAVRINNAAQPPGDTAFSLRHDENYIQISFVGVNYSDLKVRYRYRISGLRDEWVVTEENNL